MSTITLTKSGQTTKAETSSVIIKSSEHKITQNSENSTEMQESEMKKNKNANLRKSKLALSCENSQSNYKEPEAKDQHAYETQLSKAEVDGETDSAIGSSNYSLSLESLLDEVNSLELDSDQTKPKGCEVTEGSDDQSLPCLDSQTQTEIDGKRSPTPNPELGDESSQSSSMTVSSLSPCSRGSMIDLVILHTKDDTKSAHFFKQHLLNDVGISDLTVETFGNIGLGQSVMQKAATLHDSCRNILIYITDNLEKSTYDQFIFEVSLTIGLEDKEKKDRVVPVLTPGCKYKSPVLGVISGLYYSNFNSDCSSLRDSYLQQVINLVEDGRKKFPKE
ncbi:uncharacterized protein LOC132752507 [Ruditapes philippinarum]|uniref:uncharacterized protein LOC132752507 n=1 Tax=Ruditapes philippinarum TaxID=129788 RepID=UPI00295A9984|nr:uncharacterized protein LOC132752507 [Ruditapes philippinarum]XP_060598818.1 uncharacterized protein LOC132752507 [Ruditapes philippinarum]XP_060598819.1 uncharacterized protein LOC132752507 [Ruditapes philippinarum]